jgi:multisubunit Na+/H+ antiporter MnhE subunit
LLLVFEALWLLFVFQITTAELTAGAVASACSFIGMVAALRSIPLSFRPKLRWILQAYRLTWMIPVDLALLIRALFAGSQPAFEVTRLQSPLDYRRGHAHRGLAVLLMSMSPNTVVVHVDPGSELMLLHKLQPQTPSRLLERLQGV